MKIISIGDVYNEKIYLFISTITYNYGYIIRMYKLWKSGEIRYI